MALIRIFTILWWIWLGFFGGKSGFVKAKHNFVQLARALRGIYLQEIEILIEMKIGQIAIAAAMMAVSCCVANAALRVQYKGFTPTASVNVAVEDLREMAGREGANITIESNAIDVPPLPIFYELPAEAA